MNSAWIVSMGLVLWKSGNLFKYLIFLLPAIPPVLHINLSCRKGIVLRPQCQGTQSCPIVMTGSCNRGLCHARLQHQGTQFYHTYTANVTLCVFLLWFCMHFLFIVTVPYFYIFTSVYHHPSSASDKLSGSLLYCYTVFIWIYDKNFKQGKIRWTKHVACALVKGVITNFPFNP